MGMYIEVLIQICAYKPSDFYRSQLNIKLTNKQNGNDQTSRQI